MGLRYRPQISASDVAKGVKKVHPVSMGQGSQLGGVFFICGLFLLLLVTFITFKCLVAVLENYVQPNGDVVVPEVLRSYMGGLEVLNKPRLIIKSNNSIFNCAIVQFP
jgi:hypothetical protein